MAGLMEHADGRVLRALERLEGHPEFAVVMDWVARSFVGQRERMGRETGLEQLLPAQGAWQALEEFHKTALGAKELLRAGSTAALGPRVDMS